MSRTFAANVERSDGRAKYDYLNGRPETTVVRERAAVLGRATDLPAVVCEALAWRQLGFSASGVATKLDRTEATVRNYLDSVADAYGRPAVETWRDDELRAWPDAPIRSCDVPVDPAPVAETGGDAR